LQRTAYNVVADDDDFVQARALCEKGHSDFRRCLDPVAVVPPRPGSGSMLVIPAAPLRSP